MLPRRDVILAPICGVSSANPERPSGYSGFAFFDEPVVPMVPVAAGALSAQPHENLERLRPFGRMFHGKSGAWFRRTGPNRQDRRNDLEGS